MDTPHQVLTCEDLRVFQDPDGYKLVEQTFSNGSTVLMHLSQYHAIAYEVASNERTMENVLQVHEHMLKQAAKRESSAAAEAMANRVAGE